MRDPGLEQGLLSVLGGLIIVCLIGFFWGDNRRFSDLTRSPEDEEGFNDTCWKKRKQKKEGK